MGRGWSCRGILEGGWAFWPGAFRGRGFSWLVLGAERTKLCPGETPAYNWDQEAALEGARVATTQASSARKAPFCWWAAAPGASRWSPTRGPGAVPGEGRPGEAAAPRGACELAGLGRGGVRAPGRVSCAVTRKVWGRAGTKPSVAPPPAILLTLHCALDLECSHTHVSLDSAARWDGQHDMEDPEVHRNLRDSTKVTEWVSGRSTDRCPGDCAAASCGLNVL